MNTGTSVIKIRKIQHSITICEQSLFEMPNCHESQRFTITKAPDRIERFYTEMNYSHVCGCYASYY